MFSPIPSFPRPRLNFVKPTFLRVDEEERLVHRRVLEGTKLNSRSNQMTFLGTKRREGIIPPPLYCYVHCTVQLVHKKIPPCNAFSVPKNLSLPSSLLLWLVGADSSILYVQYYNVYVYSVKKETREMTKKTCEKSSQTIVCTDRRMMTPVL